MYRILITDPALKPITNPIGSWTSLDCVIRHNQVGGGMLTAPASRALLNAIQPGNRVLVTRHGEPLSSGPIEKPGAYRWSASDRQLAGRGLVDIGWADNLVYLSWRLTYPNPALIAALQDIDYYTADTVNAELLMRALVNLNAGPGALLNRRIPHLILGSVASIGTDINITTRFQALTDVLRQIAVAGGGLGFRVRESGGQLLFEVYECPDLTKKVVFSRALGNLRSMTTNPEGPQATVAIVGGTGTGAGRIVVERSTAASGTWGRIETFVNQSGVSDTTGLQQYGDTELAAKAEKTGLSAVAIDGAHARYGIDYPLGARVSTQLASGLILPDVVSSVRFKAQPDQGETVTPSVGSIDSTSDAATVRVIADLLRRIALLERT
jgi:hypothetical protein